jgi:hypothetical protein
MATTKDTAKETVMAKTSMRRGTLRIEAARINVDVAQELGRTPDPRIVKIAERSMGDNDTYKVLPNETGRFAG